MSAALKIEEEREWKQEQKQERISPVTFTTDRTSSGATVYNVNRDYITHINVNLSPGCASPEAMDQMFKHIHATYSTPSLSVTRLPRTCEPPSDQITTTYLAVDPLYNSAILSIAEVRAMIGILQIMMVNPMLCSSQYLPETLADLKRTMTLMELAIRAYRHTDLVHSLSRAISIGVEQCRGLLEELTLNLASYRHSLASGALNLTRKYVWARAGQGSTMDALDYKLRKSHSSFAACLLALGYAAWPELKRGQLGKDTLDELAKFYVELEQESTSLRHIKVDTVIVQDHLGRDLPVPMIFCTSSQDFHVVIAGFCSGLAGDVLIQRGNYRILNAGDQVIDPKDFGTLFEPGMAVTMSILFYEKVEERQGIEGYSCPRCQHVNSRCTGWVTCAKCNGSFKISPEESIVSPETEQHADTDFIPNERSLFRKISISKYAPTSRRAAAAAASPAIANMAPSEPLKTENALSDGGVGDVALDVDDIELDEANMVEMNANTADVGFGEETYGMPFYIREKGTTNYLTSNGCRRAEGTQIIVHPRKNDFEKSAQVFYIDSYGALYHAASGLAVDIVDDVPCLRQLRPVSGRPNPWSHPLPEFSFINSQIRVKFLSDPAFPSCTDDLYPNGSWATKTFLLASNNEKDFHVHPISDFSRWIPTSDMEDSLSYDPKKRSEKTLRVLVERRTKDVGGARTSWEIVPK
ncbi:hypothetical protein FIBSPDRAFT_931195 [Athelia psychrophila]|uniref:Ubiquitin-like domain-containing protein n=1 Tax=Athelia psychrophila TaxID=1759441 RepID=A0A166KR41_9AGAM|nr:hypothetical protein FIBSPDRAFT_931195 [Fibularhizoctonia sp. CBS 109695]